MDAKLCKLGINIILIMCTATLSIAQINVRSIVLLCSQDGRVFLHPSSVNSDNLQSFAWFVYFEKV